jgi:hypothetical protein
VRIAKSSVAAFTLGLRQKNSRNSRQPLMQKSRLCACFPSTKGYQPLTSDRRRSAEQNYGAAGCGSAEKNLCLLAIISG